MRDYILLIMALVLFPFVLTIGVLIHIGKNITGGFNMSSYAYNIALHLDEAGGAMLFNSNDHTISAMVYEKKMYWAVNAIDWIFRDENHCFTAWKNEFKGK